MSPTQKVILSNVGKVFRVSEAAKVSGQTSSSASKTLIRLADLGFVERIAHGLYRKIGE